MIFGLLAGILADVRGVGPDALGVEVAGRGVSMLVATHLLALILGPGAHGDRLAENR